MKLRSLAVLLAAMPLASVGQEAKLSPLVITASTPDTQSPGQVSVGVDSLRSLRAVTGDTASLLRDVPGLNLYGAGGVSSLPVIHGLADDRIRVKVDGMDLVSACANHMNPPLSYIDPSNVGSIQVFAGIAPVSLGGDSIGGTIAVNSAAPEFATAGQGILFKGQAGTFYRSNGNAKGANLSATLASEQLSMSYSGATVEAENYKAAKSFKAAGPAARDKPGRWLAGDEVGSSAYKSTNHALGFALRHDNHLVELKLGVQEMPYQGFPNQRMDMTGNESRQINLRYAGQFNWGALEARVYNETTRHKMNFGADKHYWYAMGGGVGTWPGMPMDTRGKNSGAALRADIVLSARDILRVGSEMQRYRLDDWWLPSGNGGMAPNTFWNINDGERDRIDVYAEWEARWSAQWLTQLGARSSSVTMNAGRVQGYNAGYGVDANAFNSRSRKRDDDNLDLTALARYTPDANQTYEFGYAQKTRSPNLYERYSWSTGGMAMRMINFAGDGNGYVGNLDLRPEIAHTLSASAHWHDAAGTDWGLKVSPYYTYVDGYVDAARLSVPASNLTLQNGFTYLRFVNQSARLYGLDVSGHYPLATSGTYGRFTATGMLSYVRGKNRTTDDNLYNIMPLNAKLAVVQRLGNWTNTIEAQLVDAKTNVSAVRNELQTPGYGLLHLRSSYEWKQARVDIGIENVLNKFYRYPLGGAYVGHGTTMPGTLVPWGVAVPGMGRSVYAALTVKF